MEQSETGLGELFTAIAAFAAGVEDPIKDRTAKIKTRKGADYEYDYAPLQSWIGTMRKLLAAQGLSVTQTAEGGSKEVAIFTQINHVGGGWIRGMLCMTCTDTSPQGVGTAITYARRYALMSILGIAADDDNDAGNHPKGGASAAGSSPPPSRAKDAPATSSKPSTIKPSAKQIKTIKDFFAKSSVCEEDCQRWMLETAGVSDAELLTGGREGSASEVIGALFDGKLKAWAAGTDSEPEGAPRVVPDGDSNEPPPHDDGDYPG